MKNDLKKTDSNPRAFRGTKSGDGSRAACRWFGLLSMVATFLASSSAYGFPSPVASLLSDDLKYTIQGSGTLQDWTQIAIEYTPADSAGLPDLRDIDGDGVPDWEYRTFLLDDDTLPAGFLRALISEST